MTTEGALGNGIAKVTIAIVPVEAEAPVAMNTVPAVSLPDERAALAPVPVPEPTANVAGGPELPTLGASVLAGREGLG
jgi:hypothetical protein